MTGHKRKLAGFLFLLLFLFGTGLCEIPDYKQDDPRWASFIYSSHGDPGQTVKLTGCALCAAADMVAYWFDPGVTPLEMAKLSMRLGTCAFTGGTSKQFWYELAKQYPFSAFQETTYIDTAIRCLNDGGLVIVSFVGGVWVDPTNRGKAHACLIYSYDDMDGFRLHDSSWPEGVMSRIIGHAAYEKVKVAARAYYCYWK